MTSEEDTKARFRTLLDLPTEHSLTVSGSRRETRNGSEYESHWFEEHDAQAQLIARFRTWTRQSLRPPYRKQIGWERYSLKGELLDREVRYSRRPDTQYLH
ncbi:hypothetical protein ACUNV4_08750 [Granulosicoccus sp. 3-233]|uniref:hypothetical protein n=1 Tax=Granulosicoccus sp. 3-233 TaxID=3417969 RepID=UPI003D33B6A1